MINLRLIGCTMAMGRDLKETYLEQNAKWQQKFHFEDFAWRFHLLSVVFVVLFNVGVNVPLAKVENLPNPNENYGSFSKSAVRCFSVLFCFRYSTIKNPHIYIFCKCKKCCRRQDIEQETLSKCRPTKRPWSNL